MIIKYLLKFKKILSFLLIYALVSVNYLTQAKADPITIGSLAIDTSTITDIAAYKAEIIDFASAAGYTANAEYIKATIGANISKALTVKLGSALIAIAIGAGLGSYSAYTDMGTNFKQQFSYEECLQYVWKKAMGASDEELLRFLYAAMNPTNAPNLADGSLAFKYNYDLSAAVANALYDGYFEANPDYEPNFIMDYYGPNPFEYSPYNMTANNYNFADSYFPAKAYMQAVKNYLSENEPNFKTDFFIIDSKYHFIQGGTGGASGYHIQTQVAVYDFPDDLTPIFLYNPSTNKANLTTLENPLYNDTTVWTCKRRSYNSTDYPLVGSLFFDYGLYFTLLSSSDSANINNSGNISSSINRFYYFLPNGTQTYQTYTLASYGHFTNQISSSTGDCIYHLPVYVMIDDVLYPYDLGMQRTFNRPVQIYPPADENALYNNNMPDGLGKVQPADALNTNPYIDPYNDPVPVADPVPMPNNNPNPSPTPPIGNIGDYFFPEFPDFTGLLDIPDNVADSFAKLTQWLANCLTIFPDPLINTFWWVFVFVLAILLISKLL